MQKNGIFIKQPFLKKDYGSTGLRNHMRIVFEEMSSWTPFTMYLGIKTTFKKMHI